MKHKLLTASEQLCGLPCSLSAPGQAICLICKFVVMLGPLICAAIVMLTLLGWAVYHGMEDMNRRE